MSTSTAVRNDPGVDVHRSADRVVTPGRRGVWEVGSPDASATTLYADSRHTAVEWAWNIVQGTGGKVVVHPVTGTCRERDPLA